MIPNRQPKRINTMLEQHSDLKLVYRLALALLSGLMLALSFLYTQCFILAWIALVPLLIALQRITIRQAYLLGLACGFILSVISSYWISDFIHNLKGYSLPIRLLLSTLVWLYSAHIFVIVAVAYVWIKRYLEACDYLFFPVIITAVFSVYPLLFPVQLGATQSSFLIALQAIEYTGVSGLDFIIALSNVLLWKTLTKSKSSKVSYLALLVLGVWFFYGGTSLSHNQNQESFKQVKKIGFVQTNEKPSIKVPLPTTNYSRAYPPEMEITKRLANAGAQVVIWPETRFKGYFRESHVKKAFRHQAKTLGTALIFQDVERVAVSGSIKKFNTSVFIDTSGNELETYRKRKLIAFGEKLPFFSENKKIKSFLKNLFGDFFSDYSPGEKPKIFSTGDYNFIPFICYEVLFSRFSADSVPTSLQGGKVLLVQSNDSWFGETRQPYQHIATSILRSVETRLPMIHVTNNGPSVVVSASGKIIVKTPFNERGGYLIDMPISETQSISFFSRHPRMFIYSVYAIALLMFSTAFITRNKKIKIVVC